VVVGQTRPQCVFAHIGGGDGPGEGGGVLEVVVGYWRRWWGVGEGGGVLEEVVGCWRCRAVRLSYSKLVKNKEKNITVFFLLTLGAHAPPLFVLSRWVTLVDREDVMGPRWPHRVCRRRRVNLQD
jgi:hypothetical protein